MTTVYNQMAAFMFRWNGDWYVLPNGSTSLPNDCADFLVQTKSLSYGVVESSPSEQVFNPADVMPTSLAVQNKGLPAGVTTVSTGQFVATS